MRHVKPGRLRWKTFNKEHIRSLVDEYMSKKSGRQQLRLLLVGLTILLSLSILSIIYPFI